MLPQIKCQFQKIALIVLTLNFVACGGGGGSTPSRPDPDSSIPFVASTFPASEQTDIDVISFITVTFNEDIDFTIVDTDQVSIYPVTDEVVSSERIILQTDGFRYDSKTYTLTIRPELKSLQASAIYQVEINGIRDLAGNTMVKKCKWQFGTTGQAEFGKGNIGVCGSTAPGMPVDLIAEIGNKLVTLRWSPPIIGGTPAYYLIEKSTDNGNSFVSLVPKFDSASTLEFGDGDVQRGSSYIYRVTSVNDTAMSDAIEINVVIPTVITGIPGSPIYVIAFEKNGNIGVVWGEPNLGGTPKYYKIDKTNDNGKTYTPVNVNYLADDTLTTIDSTFQLGIAYEYRVIAVNQYGESQGKISNPFVSGVISLKPDARLTLSHSVGATSSSQSIAFTPDSSTMALGLSNSDTQLGKTTGIVHTYTKSGTTWVFDADITPQFVNESDFFGISVAFDNTGLNLAVSSGKRALELFTKNGASWQNSSPTISNNKGSTTIAFSRDGTTLAEHIYSRVIVYSKSVTGTWLESAVLQAQNPAVSSGVLAYVFNGLAFSPDNTILAVGYNNSDVSATISAGIVELYKKSGATWVFDQLITADIPTKYANFGTSLAFSPDGTTLAITEIATGRLFLFNQVAAKWNLNKIIYAAFGGTVSFNVDGSQILIGESLLKKVGVDWKFTHFFTTAGYPPTLSKLTNRNYNQSAFSPDGTSIMIYLGRSPISLGIYNSTQFQ